MGQEPRAAEQGHAKMVKHWAWSVLRDEQEAELPACPWFKATYMHYSTCLSSLDVSIAERTCSRTDQILYLLWRLQVVTQINRVVQPGIAAGRRVQDRDSTADRVGLAGVQHLPDPVCAIDHCLKMSVKHKSC